MQVLDTRRISKKIDPFPETGCTYAFTDRAGISADARKLHYVGAEHIFTDEPRGNVRYRPNLKLLRKLMRPGDKLVVVNEQSLGTKPGYITANVAALEAEGVVVMFIKEDYFAGYQ